MLTFEKLDVNDLRDESIIDICFIICEVHKPMRVANMQDKEWLTGINSI